MSEYHCMSKALCCGLRIKVKPSRIQISSSSSSRYEVTLQQNSRYEWIGWDLSLDASISKWVPPATENFSIHCLCFLAFVFFWDKHFVKSLFFGYRISDPFSFLQFLPGQIILVQKWYSISFVLCFVKGPVILLYLTIWWFQREQC